MNILNRLQTAVLAILMLGTLTGCGGGAASGGETGSGDPVRIATKPMTEQYILGEMLGLLIEQAGYDVEITKGVGGGTSNIQPAMESGEFDLYPEYTSSGWVLVLDHQAEGVDDAEMFTRLQQEYEEKFHMTWVGKYGFNNTFTVAVRGDVAEQYGLETTSDLAGAAGELTFGGNPDYLEREDGFPTLCKTYGLDFRNVVDIDIGLKYQALAGGDIDVTNAFTTDAQLANPDTDLVTLEDDKHLQVNYFCSTVVRRDALEKFPGLEEVLMQMDGILSDGEMAALNYQVEVEGRNERDAARDFLLQKGLLSPDTGRVLIQGQDVARIDPVALRRRIGYAIQNVGLFPHMTVEKNIAYVPAISGLEEWKGKQCREKVAALLKQVGLDPALAGRYPRALSGGQRQRVGIARALAAGPELLLMDEPFGAVDEITRGQLQDELLRIHRESGITVLFVTHDIAEALKLGTRTLVMDAGQIQQYDAPSRLLAHPATSFVERLVRRSRVFQTRA